MASPIEAAAAPRRQWLQIIGRAIASPACVGACFFALYLSSGALVPGDDMRPTVFVPRAWMRDHALTFSPADYPFMFRWLRLGPAGPERFSPLDRAQLAGAVSEGPVRLVGPKYYVVPTHVAGAYASIFGPLPGLLAVPSVALLALFDPAGAFAPERLAQCARWTAALLAAATVMLVYMLAAARLSRGRALLAALVLGAGTSLWSTTSQGLLQHGPCTLGIVLAIFALWTPTPSLSTARLIGAGAALGLAVCARPTALVLALALLGYTGVRYRGRVLALVLGALPFALALGVYNDVLFGAPWTSAQTLVDRELLLHTVRTTELWSTPLALGAAGLIASPGRGLLVYSPCVAWAAVGLAASRGEERVRLGVLACATLGMWGLAFKWYDWWGGWCYGYRPLVDTLPLLLLCMLPALEKLRLRSVQATVFGVALAWSIGVQALGAFAYEPLGWNAKHGQDINAPEHRKRLWDWSDGPIIHYARHFSAARALRLRLAGLWVKDPRI